MKIAAFLPKVTRGSGAIPLSKRTLRRSATDLAIITMIVVGIVCSWLAEVVPVEGGFRTHDTAGKAILVIAKPALYYVAHAVSVVSLISAGLCAGLKNNFQNLTSGARIALPVLAVLAVGRAVLSYSAAELVSSTIFSATGPFVWLLLILVSAGAMPGNWVAIDRLIRILSYVSAGLALRTLLLEPYAAFVGFSKYILYAMLLTWLGGWTLLTATRLSGWRLGVRLIPYSAALLMALCGQSRSWTLLGLIVGLVFVVLRGREQGSVSAVLRILGGTFAATAVIAACATLAFPQTISRSLEGFQRRFNDDTRTGQYEAFFASVPPGDLILGRGPKGTWYWLGWGEYQFFDNGYLWTLFIGGIPTLICLITVLIWPGVRAIRRSPHGFDVAAASLVLLYGLALTGLSTFTVPTLGLTGCLMALYSGRCHALVTGAATRRPRA